MAVQSEAERPSDGQTDNLIRRIDYPGVEVPESDPIVAPISSASIFGLGWASEYSSARDIHAGWFDFQV